ncbi:hypothetical protein BJ912DRAFT_1148040 [Pholiota molesta]|nr:hypothetical protein BJ912DRAFT_1148040 [Pholiota molesta]
MLALPTLTPTPITRLRQSAATSPRTLNRWVTTMPPSPPAQDSGSANPTARETKPAMRSQNGGRGRGHGPGGLAEDVQDGMEARRGGWKGRGGRGRRGARPADARERPTHFLSLPLHTHADLRDRVSAFQNALFATPSSSSPTSVAQPSTVKGKRPLRVSSIVDGLDSSIVIDPRRLHMTLGVMALQKEPIPPAAAPTVEVPAPPRPTLPTPSTPTPTAPPTNSTSDDASQMIPAEHHDPEVSPTPEPAEPPRTVTTALALLRSLQPQISAILDGSSGVQVPLEVLDVLKTSWITAPRPRRETNAAAHHDSDAHAATQHDGDPPIAEEDQSTSGNHAEPVQEAEHVDKVGAGVLFVGPRHVARAEEDDERRKLREVSELIHRAFKDAGYITEQRPLKLHCTILNASHRKPARRAPFAYTDVIAASSACALLDMPGPVPAVAQAQEDEVGAPSVVVTGVPPRPPPPSSSHAVGVDADVPSSSVSLGDATMVVDGLEETYTPTVTAASTPDAPPPPPCAPAANPNANAQSKAKAKEMKAQSDAEAEQEQGKEEAEPRPRYRPHLRSRPARDRARDVPRRRGAAVGDGQPRAAGRVRELRRGAAGVRADELEWEFVLYVWMYDLDWKR